MNAPGGIFPAARQFVTSHTTVAASASHPFIGLRPFGLEDREFFFGRDRQVESLQQQLVTSRLISVIGSSGTGKSSLIRAGLLPRLHAEPLAGPPGWDWIETRPGSSPIRNLAEALSQPNQTNRGGKEYDAVVQ